MTGDYDTDILTWSERQADLLRRVGAGEAINEQIDWDNLAEEIDSVGESLRRELLNRITTLLTHLLKLEASPASAPRGNWRETIQAQRDEIAVLIEDSPSLESTVSAVIDARLPKARNQARLALSEYGEQPTINIDERSYTQDQVIGDWWPPEE
jgi:hypothetical protein